MDGFGGARTKRQRTHGDAGKLRGSREDQGEGRYEGKEVQSRAGLDSGLGTCSPGSEDHGLVWSLERLGGGGGGDLLPGPDWLDSVVAKLQTVFVTREENRRGSRRRRGRGRSRRTSEGEDGGKRPSHANESKKEASDDR